MKSISKYLIIIVAIIGMAIQLPELYSTIFAQKIYSTHAQFSPVLQDFVFTKRSENGTQYYDLNGNQYDKKEYIELLPFQNYSTLARIGKTPDVVNGQKVERAKVYQEKTTFLLSPSTLDTIHHYIDLHPLFESVNELGNIETPDDLFRVDARMEFLNPDTNSVKEEKTVLFTNALIEKGFQFPALLVFGNEDSRKPFDFGYFFIDSVDNIYHIYQAEGKPIVTKVELDVDGKIIYMGIKEQSLPIYGFIVTDKGNIYEMSRDNYSLQQIYIENYNPYANSISYSMDLQNRSVKVTDMYSVVTYVSDRAGNKITSTVVDRMKSIRGQSKKTYDVIFPFTIDSNPYTKSHLPIVNVSENFKAAFILSIILALIYVIYYRRKSDVIEVALVLATGIYAFLALVVLAVAKKFSK